MKIIIINDGSSIPHKILSIDVDDDITIGNIEEGISNRYNINTRLYNTGLYSRDPYFHEYTGEKITYLLNPLDSTPKESESYIMNPIIFFADKETIDEETIVEEYSEEYDEGTEDDRAERRIDAYFENIRNKDTKVIEFSKKSDPSLYKGLQDFPDLFAVENINKYMDPEILILEQNLKNVQSQLYNEMWKYRKYYTGKYDIGEISKAFTQLTKLHVKYNYEWAKVHKFNDCDVLLIFTKLIHDNIVEVEGSPDKLKMLTTNIQEDDSILININGNNEWVTVTLIDNHGDRIIFWGEYDGKNFSTEMGNTDEAFILNKFVFGDETTILQIDKSEFKNFGTGLMYTKDDFLIRAKKLQQELINAYQDQINNPTIPGCIIAKY